MIGGYHRPDRSAFVAIGLTVISFLLMTFDIRSSQAGVAETLRNGAQTIAAPLQRSVNTVVDPVVDFSDGLANLANLRAENERLRTELEEARREAASVAVLESQIEQLRILQGLRLSDNLEDSLIAAELTARGGALELSFTIDKGRSSGVLVGHPVIDLNGALIGIISAVTDSSATVVPITARSDRPGVTVRIGDTDEVGTVGGQGTDTLVLSVFDATQPVEEGQLIRTLGSDSFPPDLDIGIVLENALPLAQVIRAPVEPLVDFDRIRFVGVIPWPPEETPDLPVEEEPPPEEGATSPADPTEGEAVPVDDGEVSEDASTEEP